jgi:Cu(I)/Ag(I) efflux system membrane fusion protein
MVKTGQRVRVVPETAPDKDFRATISFVEPFYRTGSKSVTARVYFDNSMLKLPIGSQVRATVFGDYSEGQWLPREAVLSLGLEKVVFERTEGGFIPRKIKTGREHKQWVEVRSGLMATDSVATNAQYLMDSESFIKIKG